MTPNKGGAWKGYIEGLRERRDPVFVDGRRPSYQCQNMVKMMKSQRESRKRFSGRDEGKRSR